MARLMVLTSNDVVPFLCVGPRQGDIEVAEELLQTEDRTNDGRIEAISEGAKSSEEYNTSWRSAVFFEMSCFPPT